MIIGRKTAGVKLDTTMIKINSSVQFSFMFPADIATTFAYYSDMQRLVQHLKYIELVDSEPENENEHRIYYNTVELGSYHIHVLLRYPHGIGRRDDHSSCTSRKFPPVKTKVTLNSTTARGHYASEALFSQPATIPVLSIPYPWRPTTPPQGNALYARQNGRQDRPKYHQPPH